MQISVYSLCKMMMATLNLVKQICLLNLPFLLAEIFASCFLICNYAWICFSSLLTALAKVPLYGALNLVN